MCCCSCQTLHCLSQADDSYVGPCPAEFFVGSMGEEEKIQIEIRFNHTHDTRHDANARDVIAERCLVCWPCSKGGIGSAGLPLPLFAKICSSIAREEM